MATHTHTPTHDGGLVCSWIGFGWFVGGPSVGGEVVKETREPREWHTGCIGGKGYVVFFLRWVFVLCCMCALCVCFVCLGEQVGEKRP